MFCNSAISQFGVCLLVTHSSSGHWTPLLCWPLRAVHYFIRCARLDWHAAQLSLCNPVALRPNYSLSGTNRVPICHCKLISQLFPACHSFSIVLDIPWLLCIPRKFFRFLERTSMLTVSPPGTEERNRRKG